MINNNAIDLVSSARFSSRFRRPLADSYCFSRIPGTLIELLTGEHHLPALPRDVLPSRIQRPKRVVLMLVDAFGWAFFQRYSDLSVLQRAIGDGVASVLTSQFPSTTAAHVTTIHTGQPVWESGIYEWAYFEPKVGAMILPLLFSYARDDRRDTLLDAGFSPSDIFTSNTLYRMLASRGVSSFVYQHEAYTPSSFSDVVFSGAQVRPYRSLSNALELLGNELQQDHGTSYHFFYYDVIDAIGHKFGPQSVEFTEAILTFFAALEQGLRQLSRAGEETLLILTADHGQTSVNPRSTIYLDYTFPDFSTAVLDAPARPEKLAPAGSARDLFLHIVPERVPEVVEGLRRELDGRAEVYATAQLLEEGLFSSAPSIALEERMGNVVVLPYSGESVWWRDGGRLSMNFFGHHGGLTPEEMEIPFLALPL